jgi:hypothetical protein
MLPIIKLTHHFESIDLLVASKITPSTIQNTPNALLYVTSSFNIKYASAKVNIGELNIKAETT